LAEATEQPSYHKLQDFLARERSQYTVFPPEPEVFSVNDRCDYLQRRTYEQAGSLGCNYQRN